MWFLMSFFISNFIFSLLWIVVFFFHTASLEAKVQCYNFTASEGFVWFRIAKVGTTSIYEILRKNQVPFSVNAFNVPYEPMKYNNVFKFVFVRNPWDRIVSCYCNKIVKKCWAPFAECYDKDFDYFIDFINRQDLAKADRHIKLQTKMFPYFHVNFIGRFETFEKDLRYVLKAIGLKDVNIPKANPSRHKHYSQYYTARTKKIIARKYEADIEAFGYRFETK